MRLMSDLIPMKLYSSKRKVMLPIDMKDKKHGSAIFLMGQTMEENEKILNLRYLFKGDKLFRAFYIDRNVANYIDSTSINDKDDEEIEEPSVMTEGIIHTGNDKFIFKNTGIMDELTLKSIYNGKTLKWCMLRLGMQECPVNKFIIQLHPNIDDLQKSLKYNIDISDKKKMNSYTIDDTIHIIPNTEYDEKSMDGPYNAYCIHELIYCLIINEYPSISRKIAICAAMALSGQIEWLRKEKKKDEFKYHHSKDEHIEGLYIADVIYQIYETKGGYGIKKFLEGNTDIFYSIAGRRVRAFFNSSLKESLVEGTLTAKQKAKLKDSDYGIPSKKKYPMPDEAHVKAAIRMFNHCDKEDEAELAKAIKCKMKEFSITDIKISDKNRLSNYITEGVIIDEGYFISKDDTEYNYDLWDFGQHNILYVTGLSGGGKSTTAQKICRNTNAIYIELDRITDAFQIKKKPKEYRTTDERLIVDYIEKNHISKNPRFMNDNEHDKYFFKCFDYMLSQMKKDKNTLYVVEGIQVIKLARRDNTLFKEPMIIKNTSMITSIVRRLGRDKEIRVGDKTDIINAIEWYLDQEYSLNCLRKAAKSFNEGYFINSKDIEYNFSSWKPGAKNILYITGLSGGGKSTLSKELAKKYNAKYIELDELELFDQPEDLTTSRDDDKFVAEYIKKDPPRSNLNRDARDKYVYKIFKYIRDQAKKDKGHLYIIEGIQIVQYVVEYNDKSILSEPLIFKNTSALTSVIRKIKRDGDENLNLNKLDFKLFRRIYEYIDWYLYQEKGLKSTRKLAKKINKVKPSSFTIEAATVQQHDCGIPFLDYKENGDPIIGRHSKEYYDVLEILSTLSLEEYKIVSLYPVYKDSPSIKKRIVLKDPNDVPMAFMDVYWFEQKPHEAQITTAASKYYRGHHLCAMMLKELLESDFAEEYGVRTFVWNAHPDNEASKKIAISGRFKLKSEEIDHLGRQRYEYHTPIYDNTPKVNLEKLPESTIILDEFSGIVFREADDVESKYDKKLRRYLYKERLRNNREILPLYEKIKANHKDIYRTYRELKLYKGQNVYVDTSYYHGLYLQNNKMGNTKRGIYMYLDFLTRLMDNQEFKSQYHKFTYFFPVFSKPGVDLLDWKTDMNILSVICYLVKKDPDRLKKWANGKDMIFLGENGYFVIDFNNFNNRNFVKFKSHLNKLLSNTPIIDNDPIDDNEDIFEPETDEKGSAISVIDKIEKSSKIAIDDLTKVGSASRVGHLIMNTSTVPMDKKSEENAILVVTPDTASFNSEIKDRNLKSNDIIACYKPSNK